MNASPKAEREAFADAWRDTARLKAAAAEFFEEGYEYPVASGILRDTPVELQAEARAKLMSARSVPDGCFVWIYYLVWLERAKEVADLALTAAELEGLMLLRQERLRFQAAHPPCPRCGMPNAAHLLRCRECMAEIGR